MRPGIIMLPVHLVARSGINVQLPGLHGTETNGRARYNKPGCFFYERLLTGFDLLRYQKKVKV
jgi:hypothetical protein